MLWACCVSWTMRLECAALAPREAVSPWTATAHARAQGCPWISSAVDCQQMLWDEGPTDPAQQVNKLKPVSVPAVNTFYLHCVHV